MRRFASQGMIAAGLAAVVSLTFAGLVLSQPPDRGNRSDRPSRVERMAEKLDLTQDQQLQIEQIFEAAEGRRSPLWQEMAQIRNQIQGEMLKDDPSKDRVVQWTRQLSDVRAEMSLLRVDQQFAVHAVLTPEQRQKMITMRGERGERGGERHGRGYGGGGR